MIGCREIDAQHPEDRCQEALGLTQRSVEDETERQGGFDGEIGRLALPAPPADASRCPRGDRVGREPEGDVASPHEGSVVLGPVPDAIRGLVLRMHSRLQIEIMTRLRSRWSTCRPLLAHRAESAHQRLHTNASKAWTVEHLDGRLGVCHLYEITHSIEITYSFICNRFPSSDPSFAIMMSEGVEDPLWTA